MTHEASADDFRVLLSQTMAMEAVLGRVVMVCGSLQPGGTERQVANTIVGLSDCGKVESLTLLCDFLRNDTKNRYDFYLPAVQKSGAIIREPRQSPDKGHRMLPPGFRKVMYRLHPGLAADVASLYWEFRSMRPEVVHAWLDWSNVRAGLAAVLAGVPRVLLSGRNLSPRHFSLHASYFHPAYCALSEHDQDQVVLLNNSQAGANDYASWLSLPAGRIKVIRNGICFSDDMRPTPEHASAFREKLGIPAHAPVIGGMFRFNEEKRPLLWLHVAACVARALPDAHFILFGQGDMRVQMEDLIRQLGIMERVHMCGVITPSLAGLSPCDLILLTSRGEGTPNVLLEAQWIGLPVVALNAGGAAEAVSAGVTGIVVDSEDVDDVADAVLSILRDDRFRAAARLEGPKFVNARYGNDRMISETLEVYRLGKNARNLVAPA